MSQEISAPVPTLLDPPASPPMMNHGRTPAGWLLFWVASLGTLIAAIGAVMFNWVVIGVGAAVVVIGLVLSGVLRLMGHGQPLTKSEPPTVEDL